MTFWTDIFAGFVTVVREVALSIAPIVVIFLILNITSFKLKRQKFWHLMKGFFLTFIGLVLFLHGVNIAYVPVGQHLGHTLAAMENNWILVPLGFFMGFLVGFAEPAIHVMTKQVEEISAGRIKSRVMLMVVALGVGSAVGLSMWRLLVGFSIYWFLIPGYTLVFLLGRKVDKMFLAMAFDNGGVATGPMCSTFILSMCVAIASEISGRDPLIDGFGVVALIALAPILTTMLLGYIYKRKDLAREKNLLETAQKETV
ncbi:DUF1538 domain-containing protein [Enterococcus timonensis]|uniref:DUF1538 domain-containing protein n=1 Tax=Enterococcus timonensis TaxID=1852364 RepID=UPI0008DA266B|nr:DUF1538 domain-containing protein [Enterococcus timonensis]